MRSSRRRIGTAALALLGAVTAVGACGEGDRHLPGGPIASFDHDAAVTAPPCEGRRCSRDLKKVLHECDDGVIEACGPKQGCGQGACVDACAAAELSKGSIGCSFWTLPPAESRYSGSCFAAMIANTWDQAVTIRAELGTDALDLRASLFTASAVDRETVYTPLTGPLPPGEVAIVFLSQEDPAQTTNPDITRCPYGTAPALRDDPTAPGTRMSRAFHLTTDAPVSAYSIYPYGGARTFYPSATLLLPESAWDKTYLAVSSWPHGATWPPKEGRPFVQVVAREDDTEVSIRPSVAIEDGATLPGSPKGEPRTWKLSRGQVLQIVQIEELTGSPIKATKPIGLFGGAECQQIPAGVVACDIVGQQIPALSQWGSEYPLVPYRPRLALGSGMTEVRETVPWRLVGAADGTLLTYDPVRPGGAPETLAAGQVATFLTDKTLVVRSQDKDHPFYAASYMTGAYYGSDYQPPMSGDPEFVNVVSSEQFLDRYIFFVDYTFPDSTLTVVRKKTSKGYLPVTLDCAGELTDFRPLGTSGDYEFTWLRLTEGMVPQRFAGGTCTHGPHEAHSEGPFSLTVWGTGETASYGYAGGMGSRPVNDIAGSITVN